MDAALAVIGIRQPLELGLKVSIGQRSRIDARGEYPQITNERRRGAQACRELLALALRCAPIAGEILCEVQSTHGISGAGGLPQQTRGALASVHQIDRCGRKRSAYAAVRIGGSRVRLPRRETVVAHQRRGDFRFRERPKAQTRTARPNSRQQRIGHRRHEQENRRRWRLFERLEQRVLRRNHERVGLVDDHDPAAALEWTVRRPVDDVPNLLDLDRARVSRRKRDHVRVYASLNAATRRACATAVALQISGRGRLQTVDRFGRGPGCAALTHTCGPRKQQGRRERIVCDRARHEREKRPMTYDVTEGHPGTGYSGIT